MLDIMRPMRLGISSAQLIHRSREVETRSDETNLPAIQPVIQPDTIHASKRQGEGGARDEAAAGTLSTDSRDINDCSSSQALSTVELEPNGCSLRDRCSLELLNWPPRRLTTSSDCWRGMSNRIERSAAKTGGNPTPQPNCRPSWQTTLGSDCGDQTLLTSNETVQNTMHWRKYAGG